MELFYEERKALGQASPACLCLSVISSFSHKLTMHEVMVREWGFNLRYKPKI